MVLFSLIFARVKIVVKNLLFECNSILSKLYNTQALIHYVPIE